MSIRGTNSVRIKYLLFGQKLNQFNFNAQMKVIYFNFHWREGQILFSQGWKFPMVPPLPNLSLYVKRRNYIKRIIFVHVIFEREEWFALSYSPISGVMLYIKLYQKDEHVTFQTVFEFIEVKECGVCIDF
jgi:hypothetical protein